MAYTQNKEGHIIINGWDKGIAPSPYQGFGDMKNVNITTIPGEASVNYARTKESQPVVINGTISMGVGTTVVQTGGTAMTEGMWVTVSASTITGLANGSYFVVSLGGTNYQFYSAFFSGVQTATGAGTATIISIDMGKLLWKATEKVSPTSYRYYVMDSTGRVWVRVTGNTKWHMINNVGVSNAGGLVVYKGYLFRFSDATIEYIPTGALATAWATFHGLTVTGNISRYAISAYDDTVYFCGGRYIGEFLENPGATFDPANAATYTFSEKALYLPAFEQVTTITEMTNNNLLIGCTSNSLYTWDKITTLATFPMLLPEANTATLVVANNLVYIFCGNKGNIYVSNGSNITNVLTIPDYITGQIEPYYIWYSAMYLRGRVYFSIESPNCGGVWSFVPTVAYYAQQVNSGSSLRLENQNSYGTYAGAASLLFAPQEPTAQQARGAQYWAAWESSDTGSATYGVDFSATTPYTGGQAIIETDIIPVGTFLVKRTFNQIEYKLATPLVADESVEIQYRTNINEAFTSVFINSTVGAISGNFGVTFQTLQWLQLKIILTSTATNPSFVRLTEVRII